MRHLNSSRCQGNQPSCMRRCDMQLPVARCFRSFILYKKAPSPHQLQPTRGGVPMRVATHDFRRGWTDQGRGASSTKIARHLCLCWTDGRRCDAINHVDTAKSFTATSSPFPPPPSSSSQIFSLRGVSDGAVRSVARLHRYAAAAAAACVGSSIHDTAHCGQAKTAFTLNGMLSGIG